MIPSALFLRVAVPLIARLPLRMSRWAARGAGTAGYLLAGTRRRTLLANHRALAPDADSGELRRRVRRTFLNLCDAAVDLLRLPSIAPDAIRRLITVDGLQHLEAAIATGYGVVIVTPHLGPYELGGAWMALEGYPVHAMVEDLAPDDGAAMARLRTATGMRLLSRDRGTREALRLLRERQLLLLVADRVVGHGAPGLAVPFGAGRRRIPLGPAALALATGAPIVVGHIARAKTGPARYRITLEPPIHPLTTDDVHADRERLTRQVGARLAALVEAHPDQWFVFQPEWLPA